MTELGEGVAVPVSKKSKDGKQLVKEHDACTNDPVEGADVTVGSDKKTSNSSGEASFDKLPVGTLPTKVVKHFKDADYSTFLVHYPRVMRSHKAKSTVLDSPSIKEGAETKTDILLEVYKVLDEIVFHRRHIDIGGADKYGHWWSVFAPNMSFGWWPKYPVGHQLNRRSTPPVEPTPLSSNAGWREKASHMFATASYKAALAIFEAKEGGVGQTLRGVDGELNGVTAFGGIARPGMYVDPHAGGGDSGNEQYSPVIKECTDIMSIRTSAEAFSTSYSGDWSWRFEAGNHCHTFQKALMRHLHFDKYKVIK